MLQERELTAEILTRSSGEEGVITVGIVSEKVDTYNTYINPDGCDSPAQSIVVDFRHNRINTGCRVDNLRTENVNGVKTLVADIKVPKQSSLYIRAKDGRTIDDGNTYDAVKSGRIMGVSVEFDPRPYPEFTREDRNGRIYYEKWRCLRITLLDEPPSQDQAHIINKSNFRSTNMPDTTTQPTPEQEPVIQPTPEVEKPEVKPVGTAPVTEDPTVETPETRADKMLKGKIAKDKEPNDEMTQDQEPNTRADDTMAILTRIESKIDKFLSMEACEDETETRSAHNNPTLIPVKAIQAGQPSESRGVGDEPATLPKKPTMSLEQRIIESKLRKQHI